MDLYTTTTPDPSIIDSAIDFNQLPAIWILVLGIILSYWLAVGLGANDVSNAFDATWGNEIISITGVLGAIFLGFSSTNTIRREVVDLRQFAADPYELMLGQIAILAGATTWLLVATFIKLPVSPSQSLIGSILGFAVVRRGTHGVTWRIVGKIITFWYIAPFASALLSITLYIFIDIAVLRRKDPFKCVLRLLPVFFFVLLAINGLAVFFNAPDDSMMSRIPNWAAFLISFGGALIVAVIIQLFVKPLIISKIPETESLSTDSSLEHEIKQVVRRRWGIFRFFRWLNPQANRMENIRTMKVFTVMQMFTAGFSGFANGASDMSNIIAPLSILVDVFITKKVDQDENVPIYLMIFAVVGRCAGLWAFGEHIQETIGQKLYQINPAIAVSIELGSGTIILYASKVGLPMSNTHCMVGSTVGVGALRHGLNLKWNLVRNMIIYWFLTMPCTGLISAGVMEILYLIADNYHELDR